MSSPLHAWRDALQDLGLMGLVPPPAPAAVVGAEPSPVALGEGGSPRPNLERSPRPVAGSAETPRRAPVADPPQSRTPRVPPSLAPQSLVSQPLPPQPLVPMPNPGDPKAFPTSEAVASASDLDSLRACIQDCLACPLGTGRIRFVFGEGSPRARMMFIGEGPGRDEDLQGRPFVGKAGELLEKMIQAIGFQRSDVFIANVVKCRPPDNRTPLPEESQRCLPYLKRQIELIQPKVIVLLGATPLRELLGVSTGITRIRGQWQRLEMLGGIPVMPTFHPAYVLRQYTQEVRRAVWGDLQAARKWLDESEKPTQTSE